MWIWTGIVCYLAIGGHKGAHGVASPEREAEIIREWRELHNGTQGAVGAEFEAFRQGFLYGVEAELSRGKSAPRTDARCRARDGHGDGVRCELPVGHGGNHTCPEALARFRR